MKKHRSVPSRAATAAVGLALGVTGAIVTTGVDASPSFAAPTYAWSSIGPAKTQSELSTIGLGHVNYGVFKGKSVGVVELAPIEPVTRIETDFDKCVTANGGTIKLVDTGGDPTKGVAAVQNFLQEKVAGIWNDALDPTTIVPEITTANRARVPLITAWSGASANSVGINGLEVQSAARLAQYVIDRLGGTGQVVMLGSTATQSLRERDAAFMAVAKQYPGIKIVADQSVNVASPTEDANSALKAILQANPNIGAVWTDFDEIGVGAAQALQAAHSKAFVVGFNGDKQALADIRNPSNPYAATMANDLEVSGDVGCAEMATMLSGGKPPARNIYMDSPIVTKANISASGYVHGSGPFLIYTEPLAQRWPSS